jgi:large subunit ribosomal protein L40e
MSQNRKRTSSVAHAPSSVSLFTSSSIGRDESSKKKRKSSHHHHASREERKTREEQPVCCDGVDFSPLRDACHSAATEFSCDPERALLEFQRFLELKVFTLDVDGSKLEPTPLMERMWRAAVLDTRFYARLQRRLGMLLHRRRAMIPVEPDRTAQLEEQARRKKALDWMRGLYYLRYDEKPYPTPTPPILAPPAPPPLRPPPIFDSMQLFVRVPSGRTITLNVHPDDRVEGLKQRIQEHEGIPPQDQRVIFSGSQLNDGRTLAECGMQTASMLNVVLRLRGC